MATTDLDVVRGERSCGKRLDKKAAIIILITVEVEDVRGVAALVVACDAALAIHTFHHITVK